MRWSFQVADLNNLVEELQSQREALIASNAEPAMDLPVEKSSERISKERDIVLSQIMRENEDRVAAMQGTIAETTKQRDELKTTVGKLQQAAKEVGSQIYP